MRLRAVCFVAYVASVAHAAPPTPADVTRLCGEAEGPAHCGRLIEAEQLKRLPGLATREGHRLRVTLFPSGTTEFADVDTPSGGTSYALWDYVNELNAVVLWTTKDDDISFVLLQRATGRLTVMPAEPVVSPDRQRLATADFCPTRCENRLAVWRVSRDAVVRELEWSTPETWSDASVRWKDADTLVVEYTRAGETDPRTLERRLADPGWSRR